MGDKEDPPTPSAGQADSGVEGGPPPLEKTQTAPGLDQVASGPHSQSPVAVSGQYGFAAQFDMIPSPPPSAGRHGPFNMAPMANALPHGGFRHGHYPHQGIQQRYHSTPSSAGMQHMPQMPPFTGPPMPMPNQDYYAQPPMPPFYGAGQLPATQGQSNASPRPPVPYYTNQVMMNHPPAGYYYAPSPQYNVQPQPISTNMMPSPYMVGSPTSPGARAMHRVPDDPTMPQRNYATGTSEQRQNVVRGPPRKPRQSGHAIWIGNLPPQTDLMNLVHHVCQETLGLESLFLISKSNCAFANFKDEPACVAAQQKLHDSKFHNVRLVSRLRKNTVEGASGVTAPTGPAGASNSSSTNDQQGLKITPTALDSDRSTPSAGLSTPTRSSPSVDIDASSKQDKFFILKSLTVDDLELSVRTGIWATQSHNEEALNKAYKAADNVYLVFSANKSGEYFGYARMLSEIDEDPAAAIEFAPKAQAATELDLPKAIPTEATEHAPKGRIIDDSARGTIFWEADHGDADSDSENENESETASIKSGNPEEGAQTWGKPFKLEWLSTNRLPFYRTRGLRNPWNSNREVKIARDGTELEPSTGRKLIGLFNRVQSPGPATASLGIPMGMTPGYGQPRPFGR